MVFTESVLDIGEELKGAVLLVPDDPRLLELGRFIEKECGHMKCLSVLPDGSGRDLLYALRDIPLRAFGLLWRADLEEELLSGSGPEAEVLCRVPYHDPESLFGRPALCLLSRHGPSWRDLPKVPSIALDRRYPNLARDYLRYWSGAYRLIGSDIEGPIGWQGPFVGADLALSLVGSPEILERTDFRPLDRILDSDPVLIRIGQK